MNQNKIIFTYFLLSVILIGSAVLLALQVRQYLHERNQDPLAEFRGREVNESEVLQRINDELQANRRATLAFYNQTKAFLALATPQERPSPTPRPQPTPTPKMPAINWKIKFATNNMVMLLDPKNQNHTKRIGEVCEDPVNGNFIIQDIDASDFSNPKVKVRHVDSGVVGTIDVVAQ